MLTETLEFANPHNCAGLSGRNVKPVSKPAHLEIATWTVMSFYYWIHWNLALLHRSTGQGGGLIVYVNNSGCAQSYKSGTTRCNSAGPHSPMLIHKLETSLLAFWPMPPVLWEQLHFLLLFPPSATASSAGGPHSAASLPGLSQGGLFMDKYTRRFCFYFGACDK